VTAPDGTNHQPKLYARGGTLGFATETETGDSAFTPLMRLRTQRNRQRFREAA